VLADHRIHHKRLPASEDFEKNGPMGHRGVMNWTRHRQRIVHLVVGATFVLVGGTSSSRGQAAPEEKRDFGRWEVSIAAFERQDKTNPPPRDAVLFAGSSSIRLWDLRRAFPRVATINRGFGGSRIADSTHFANRIILKQRPRTIVFYAGDNDIAEGRTPEQVHADFLAFVETVQKELPTTKIIYIGIKPSPLRWKQAATQQEANALIKKYCESDERLRFIDTFGPMLGADGMPRGELYRQDRLHLSARGYELWNSLVGPVIN
jgi:lysophospholipase L1-like esterase